MALGYTTFRETLRIFCHGHQDCWQPIATLAPLGVDSALGDLRLGGMTWRKLVEERWVRRPCNPDGAKVRRKLLEERWQDLPEIVAGGGKLFTTVFMSAHAVPPGPRQNFWLSSQNG